MDVPELYNLSIPEILYISRPSHFSDEKTEVPEKLISFPEN